MIRFERVSREKKQILKQLLEFYSYDLSAYTHNDVDPDGTFGYKFLDHYWIEEGRHAYFILSDDNYAGFIMINQALQVATSGNCIAEFFIMKKYRRLGLGRKAAQFVFKTYPGSWEVSMIKSNKPSTHFWHKIVDDYTDGIYKSTSMEIDGIERIILTFTT